MLERLGTKPVAENGVALASDPSSRGLRTDASYYWIAKYSGDPHHAANASVCGSETMTFGTPPPAPGRPGAGALSQFKFVGHPIVDFARDDPFVGGSLEREVGVLPRLEGSDEGDRARVG